MNKLQWFTLTFNAIGRDQAKGGCTVHRKTIHIYSKVCNTKPTLLHLCSLSEMPNKVTGGRFTLLVITRYKYESYVVSRIGGIGCYHHGCGSTDALWCERNYPDLIKHNKMTVEFHSHEFIWISTLMVMQLDFGNTKAITNRWKVGALNRGRFSHTISISILE